MTNGAGALGSGTITAFIWNGFLVPLGAPEMDAVVAPAFGAGVWALALWLKGLVERVAPRSS